MTAEHTAGTLSVSADGFELRVEGGAERYRFPTWIAQVYDAMIPTEEALANAKRIAACWNALKDCDTGRLVELAERGLTMELALQGSLLLENAKLAEQEHAKVLEERLRATLGLENTNDEQVQTYPLDRGDG